MRKTLALAGISLGMLIAAGLSPASRGQEAQEPSWLLKTEAPGNVFVDSATPELLFRDARPDGKLAFKVEDWLGKEAAAGEWADAAKSLRIEGLSKGYYRLRLLADGKELPGYTPFAIVADPDKWERNPESPYAMNTVVSWLTKPNPANKRQPAEPYKTAAEFAKLAGLSLVREMISWREVCPQPYEYAWGKYADNAKLLSDRGVSQCLMCEDGAPWARGQDIPGSKKLPDNLFALYDYTKNGAAKLAGKTLAWEFWNEEDSAGYCVEPAWDFAAAHKAAYLGLKEGNPKILALNGSFCIHPPVGYDFLLFENGMGDYVDVFNYHTYANFSEYRSVVSGMDAIKEKYGMAKIPTWITEAGSNYEGPGKLDSCMPDKRKEHDLEQELILAEFTPKAQILLQAQGADKIFHFVMPAYNERNGTKAWGLFRWDYTVKPAFAAFANLEEKLSKAQLQGSLDLGEGVVAFLYKQPDSTQTLVFWSKSELDKAPKGNVQNVKPSNLLEKPVALRVGSGWLGLGNAKLSLSDALGGERAVKAEDGFVKLTATRYPAYLSGLEGIEPTAAIAQKERAPKKIDEGKDLSVVFKLALGPSFTPMKNLALMKDGPGKLTLEIYNFSDERKTGKAIFSGRGKLEGLPESVTLEPRSRSKIELSFTADAGNGGDSSIELSGVFNGRKTGRLSAPVWQVTEKNVKSFDFSNPARWRKNSSGEMEISYDEKEKAMRFHADFSKCKSGDFWVYPEFPLQLPEESMKGAVGASFELKAVQKDAFKKYSAYMFMAICEDLKEKGKGQWLPYQPPSEEWKTMFVNFQTDAAQGFDPANIKLLRIGLNPEKEETTYWVRNVKIYYGDGQNRGWR